LTDVPHPQSPEWNITAGATSIYALPNLNTQQNKLLLERQLGENIDFHAYGGSHTLVGQLSALERFKSITQKWTVKVMFFSRSWVDLLRQHQDSHAAAAVKDLLLERGWKTLARVRKQKSNRLREHLNAASGDANQIVLADPAVSLLTSVDDILANRRPCFVPAWEDGDLGPFGAISSQIIDVAAKERSWILRPTYLSSDSVRIGYMRLDHASPAILNGRPAMGAKDKVRAIMGVLRTAVLSVKGMDLSSQAHFDLQSYLDLLPRIMFQTPATKAPNARLGAPAESSVPATGQGSNYFKFGIESGVKLVPVTSRDFYTPHFKIIPRERCAFFRNSLRVCATD
jgi:hypothetical protein